MTAKDLKNALLQEAVQGRLVPQIASEGNAKDLLEEIKKEKAKLIKEGKLKKEKLLPEITDDEIPFDIPENWCWCRQSDLGLVSTGMTPLKTESRFYTNGNIPWITSSLTDKEFIDTSDSFITEYALENTNLSLYPKHTLILAMYGQGKTRGQISELLISATINQACAAIELYNSDEAFRKYIKLFHNWNYNNIRKESFGSAQPNLNLGKVQSTLIPLPPLEEQKRIVTAIEHFMPLIEEYGKKEAELTALNADIAKTLKNAILQEAVQGKLAPQIASEGNAKDLLEENKAEKTKLIKEGRVKKEKSLPEIIEDEIPFDIPENWCWCRLGEIVDTNIGLTYSPSDIVEKEGIGVLRSNNIQNGKIVYDDLVQVSKKVPEKCLANKGDLLICARNGSRALVGKCALIEENGMAFGAFMAIVRSRFTPYIMYFINSPIYRAKLEGVNTTTINQITQDNLRETLIPLPPFEEQKRIVAAIEQLLTLCEKIGE